MRPLQPRFNRLRVPVRNAPRASESNWGFGGAGASEVLMATNPFIDSYLPAMFWPAEIAQFGRQVTYLPQGDVAQAVTISVLWKEGASDEEVSPGRYSHMDIQNSDLPAPPAPRDLVQKDGKQYQVVRINALAVKFSVIVLQEAGPVL